ncbi:MAG: hypothetical protein ABI361_07845 [Nitrososphaera sp.]|jgi:hypothetical protein
MADAPTCALCGSPLKFKYRPMDGWNISGLLCGKCYETKLTEQYIAEDRRGITKR